jgi:hypothetical protein
MGRNFERGVSGSELGKSGAAHPGMANGNFDWMLRWRSVTSTIKN